MFIFFYFFFFFFFFYCYGDHRDLHGTKHSFPTRRSSDHAGLVAPHEGAVSVLLSVGDAGDRSEEHTSELQSLRTSSYAVFCLKKKKQLDGLVAMFLAVVILVKSYPSFDV